MPFYIRYVDDFVLLHESAEQLHTWKSAIEFFLADRLRLKLHPNKTLVQPIHRGCDFVGYVVRLTIQINVMKTVPSSSITHDILAKLHDLRSLVENIKAFTTLLWKTKAISEGFFLTAMSLVEEISKQVVGWEKYLSKTLNKK